MAGIMQYITGIAVILSLFSGISNTIFEADIWLSLTITFATIIMTVWWGAFEVFLITSLFAACIDLSFVMMQRYNRPRVLQMIRKTS